MFKFNFDEGDLDEDLEQNKGQNTMDVDMSNHARKDDSPPPANTLGAYREWDMTELISCLPPKISYSLIDVPSLEGTTSFALPRRDLFDARFQLIASDGEEGEGGGMDKEPVATFIDAPSDLVPGVYEGGLKTWECSLDLIGYLKRERVRGEWLKGKTVLELGCGTALPSAYALHELFSISEGEKGGLETTLWMQDYNPSVLQLVTFPNLLLTWFFSPGGANHRAAAAAAGEGESLQTGVTGDVTVDDDLLLAFRNCLSDRKITLRFVSGAWSNFRMPGTFDLVMTSETIYQTISVPSLLEVLRQGREIIVAAKVLYFGVGGGVDQFVRAVENVGGRTETVWEVTQGVGRRILRLVF